MHTPVSEELMNWEWEGRTQSKINDCSDFPVVQALFKSPADAEAQLIPGREDTHASGQLSPCATTAHPVALEPMLYSRRNATMKALLTATKRVVAPACLFERPCA